MIQEKPEKIISTHPELEIDREQTTQTKEAIIGPVLPNLDNIEAPIPSNISEDIEDKEFTNFTNMGQFPVARKSSYEVKMEEEALMHPTPEEFQVKVFVINLDGNWSDCGVGMLIFLNTSEIVVATDGNDQTGKDYLEESRAENMRGNIGK